jgi:hypothetical protein
MLVSLQGEIDGFREDFSLRIRGKHWGWLKRLSLPAFGWFTNRRLGRLREVEGGI